MVVLIIAVRMVTIMYLADRLRMRHTYHWIRKSKGAECPSTLHVAFRGNRFVGLSVGERTYSWRV